MTGKRVVVAGLGDSGVLTAMRLAKHADVVGISVKPALVSGQELGLRLTRPDDWSRDYWIAFDRFRALDRVRTVHGRLTGLDPVARRVELVRHDGSPGVEDYDALVIATGVANGFWRRSALQSTADVAADLRAAHDRVAQAQSVVVIGGGAAAVSSAANIARTWPGTRVDLYHPGERPLPAHHLRVWSRIRLRLADLGVGVHGGHRAVVPDGFACDEITSGAVHWSTGQEPVAADAVLWTIGRVTPNTGWLPSDMVDDDGFVRVTPDLRVPGRPGVFAIGDVAATDPLRSSARNWAHGLLAHNVRAEFDDRPLRDYRPPTRRWGSVLGPQPDGLELFAPDGRAFRFPAWSVERIMTPLFTRKVIYHGVRP